MAKSKPKLQDTLLVFMEQLNQINKATADIHSISKYFEHKIEEIRHLKPKVDATKIEDLQEKFIGQLNHQAQGFLKAQQETISVYRNEQKKIEETLRDDKRVSLPKVLVLWGSILLAILGIGLAGYGIYQKKAAADKQAQMENSFYRYLEDSGNLSDYRDWVNNPPQGNTP